MVGKTGFEPATPWSQTKCSTKLSYFPTYGAPERSRTPNLLIRSQTLYPIELRAQIKFFNSNVWKDILLAQINDNYFAIAKNSGAEDRNRTGTVVTYRRILSPVRLPVPPPRLVWSGRRDSNPRPPPWQGGVLPLNYFREIMVRVKGLEPPRLAAPDPKSGASANSATPAYSIHFHIRENEGKIFCWRKNLW
jgi:hypothetical protein